jgi:hypothetical protein
MPALSKEEVMMRLNSEKFNANISAMAAAPIPEKEVHREQHAAAVAIVAATQALRDAVKAKKSVRKYLAAQHLGTLLEAYANTYAQAPDTY